MSVLEMVPTQLLLAFALAQTCALQLYPHALAPRAGNCASALHIQVEYILGDGQRHPNGKQLAVLFLPSIISGVVDRHPGPLNYCPDVWKTLLLRCCNFLHQGWHFMYQFAAKSFTLELEGEWWLMFYGHLCVHGRLNGLKDIQREWSEVNNETTSL